MKCPFDKTHSDSLVSRGDYGYHCELEGLYCHLAPGRCAMLAKRCEFTAGNKHYQLYILSIGTMVFGRLPNILG